MHTPCPEHCSSPGHVDMAESYDDTTNLEINIKLIVHESDETNQLNYKFLGILLHLI